MTLNDALNALVESAYDGIPAAHDYIDFVNIFVGKYEQPLIPYSAEIISVWRMDGLVYIDYQTDDVLYESASFDECWVKA